MTECSQCLSTNIETTEEGGLVAQFSIGFVCHNCGHEWRNYY